MIWIVILFRLESKDPTVLVFCGMFLATVIRGKT